jgi:hypothetical protein
MDRTSISLVKCSERLGYLVVYYFLNVVIRPIIKRHQKWNDLDWYLPFYGIDLPFYQ